MAAVDVSIRDRDQIGVDVEQHGGDKMFGGFRGPQIYPQITSVIWSNRTCRFGVQMEARFWGPAFRKIPSGDEYIILSSQVGWLEPNWRLEMNGCAHGIPRSWVFLLFRAAVSASDTLLVAAHLSV